MLPPELCTPKPPIPQNRPKPPLRIRSLLPQPPGPGYHRSDHKHHPPAKRYEKKTFIFPLPRLREREGPSAQALGG
jgi:hypothetical protein